MGIPMELKWWEKDVVKGVQEWLKNTELLTLELGWIHLITGLLKSERRKQKRARGKDVSTETGSGGCIHNERDTFIIKETHINGI